VADRDEILIKVCERCKVEGYSIMEVGVDSGGKYKIIKTPEGKLEKVYRINIKRLESLIMDRYNQLHNYRRPGDRIVLYYNTNSEDFVVLAVKPGDDLRETPFNIKDGFVVTEDMLENMKVCPVTGLVPVSAENLEKMKELNIFTDETAQVLFFNRNNVGFYL
jgi:hypothetical protein